MKKIFDFLFSSRLMAALLLVFAISIAAATFVENDYGSQTARALIYNSWWFSAMLFIGIINLSGTIIIHKLYRREKLSLFIFHIAFVCILVGAAITHYFGFEGYMHIRNGESSNQLISDNTYLRASVAADGQTETAEKRVYFSALSSNYHTLKLHPNGKEVIVECQKIIPNAQETIADDPNGVPIIELVMAGMNGRQTILLSSGQTKTVGNLTCSFNDTLHTSDISIISFHGDLEIKTHTKATVMTMATQMQDSVPAGSYQPLMMRSLYDFGDVKLVVKNYSTAGRIDVTTIKDAKPNELPDALYLNIKTEGQSKSLIYFASHNALNDPVNVQFNDVVASISFGAKVVAIPFSLHLNRFILERYPGSNSPSWFESKVVLKDSMRGIAEERRIFMNNVLKYKGYRFFQSSYDTDEGGTVLSVNHDYWGTNITYLGYLVLALGFILSLFNKNSRFRKISSELTRLRESRKAASVVAILIVTMIVGLTTASAQETVPDSAYINKDEAARFGQLLIQDPGGRIKPLNSLSSELVRKISRKTSILGQTSDQVLLEMLVFPDFWQTVPMIKVSHPEIQKILHIQTSYVSFGGVLNHSDKSPYVLNTYVNEAYQKKPASRSTFDTEIIRLDERINLCYQIYSGDLLRIFPKRDDPTHTWYSPTSFSKTFSGKDSTFAASILPLYLQSLQNRGKDPKLTNEAYSLLHTYQQNFGKDIIPSPFKIKLETIYNSLNIFDRLGSIYGLVGFLLLIFQFIAIFKPRLNLKPVITIATAIIILSFITHLAGLAARWYISGHAPWSNAYESLVYIAFATILAGLLFSKKSGFTLSVTALLAWLILFVAHLNWMDPEITNLVPVLKSYWLLIHVAIITASYGFLALGALLAFINLTLMATQTKTNYATTSGVIAELTVVIEMTLIIGLYMITIGMFLGGVWANESWGRYWGWDAKETWALVSVLVYAFVAHMRMVPGLKGNYTFNLMALLAFSSIIMTYFGVNYYLSGLHSYAKGDPLPIPMFVYYSITIVAVIAIAAWWGGKRFKEA